MGRLSSVVVAIVLAGNAGCALDRSGIGGGVRDGGELDAGEIVPADRDGGGALDGGPPADAGPPDGGARDAGVDGGPPDGGPPPLCPDVSELVACYPLDGDAEDHGPRGNHLSATSITWLDGGGALLGASSGLSIAHRAELSHASTTIVGWVRVDTIPTGGRAGVVDHDGQYGIFVHPGGELQCAITVAGSGWAIAPGVMREGVWQHVACVAEGTTLRLYVDGAVVATSPAAATRTPGASPLHLGENAPIGNDQLVGALDDLRIWDAEWDAARVLEDARRGRR